MAPYFCIIRGFDYLAAQMGMQDVRLSRAAPCLFSSMLCSAQRQRMSVFPFAAEQTHLRLPWELLLLLPFTGAASFSFGASGFGLLFGDLYFFASAAQSGLNVWVLELVVAAAVSCFCCCFDFEMGGPVGQAP